MYQSTHTYNPKRIPPSTLRRILDKDQREAETEHLRESERVRYEEDSAYFKHSHFTVS